jgi:hypothetical protein
MRNVMLGLAVSSALCMPAEVVISGAGEAVEGTVISKDLQTQARKAIKAAWGTYEKVVSTSQMVLQLAQAAVKEAKGDFKLALNKFDAAVASAASEFREEHKEASGEDKAKIDEFLSDTGSWKTFCASLRGALKDEFPVLDFQTESSLRAARKAAKDASRTRKTMRGQLGDKLDLDGLTDDEFATACKAATNESGEMTIERLEKELRRLGYVEPENEETEEERDTRLHNEAKGHAAHWLGEDERWTAPRESLAKLLVLLNSIPDDGGHENDVNRILNNAYIQINKLYRPESGQSQQQPKANERRVVDA